MKQLPILLSAAALALAILGGCGEKKGGVAANPSPEENHMVLTSQDTTVTIGLVTDFMERIVARDVKSAAAMLYTVDLDDPDGEPYPLTEEQLSEIDCMLSMPITGYEIAEYVFDTAASNEVRCKVTVSDRFTTNWYFKPVRYLGDWYLCIKDSSQGDRPLNSEQAEIAR